MSVPKSDPSPAGPAALRVLMPPPQDAATLTRLRPAAAVTALTLFAVGVIHTAWAAGSTWPYGDAETLTRSVLGVASAEDFPPAGLTLAVTGALSVTGAAALARTSSAPKVRQAARLLTLPAAAILGLRGIGGFAQSLLAPNASTPEFRRNDLRFYSPLCLALAAGLITLERSTKEEQP
ncbi:DUF3995 domain-containing protein [Propionicimonas sp.]|uniref:DUF3995 domain-containing protein n=1 Tax=Propionicimonas sp. TaxID=1955623 RepID=UPI0017FF3B81|nr:DUF3995 domain-containing protein [Propionicimonas sp.]MBU3976781.1 DUF3995 domain-containing protein [Actinomycetota bacterium]MBA3019470.1 DUF3995 domain-containing protein [Propionicimonas sp.]MBU3986876.1 DUF3995 domain-containing protein [Actinomycetota bacterium]MBU4006788.1 DUF3995 domain-containing protein [Actinomycetota bacterium]MBU4065488.1 DUF3995 domain-containing protein [Actinomycetota bacterium]